MNKVSLFNLQNVSRKTILSTSVLTVLLSSFAFAEENVNVLPTITIKAEEAPVAYKSGNMDIPRTEDDVQAYTMIEREEIERSGVTTVTELLSKVLPMATSTNNPSYFSATSSKINLRGLGASQTLVLINGRRSAGTGNRGTSESTDQPNLNNIPLAAIERIEVLPTSAAAIYGSGAIGGVINVILRKDYVGTEVDFRYANTTSNSQPVKSVNLVSGFSLEDGRTNVMVTASKKEQDSLTIREAGWSQKARQNILKNNPSSIYGMNTNGTAVNPPAGNLTNIRTKDGSELVPGWGSSYAHLPSGWSGDISKLGQGYALDLANAMGNWSGDGSLLSDTTTEAISISINRDFTDRLNVFLEAGYDREEGSALNTSPHTGFGTATVSASSPHNPFGKDILVAYPVSWDSTGQYKYDTFETTQKKIATGFTFNLTSEWLLSADYAWSKSDIRQQYARRGSTNPKASAWATDLANNRINFIGDFTTQPTDIVTKYWNYPINNTKQTLQDMSIRSTGPVAKWYAGSINLATGIEHRRYESEGFAEHGYVDNPWIKPAERKTNASSIYAELNVPLISPELNIPFAKILDVQLATRYEDFNVHARVPQYVADSTTGYRSKLTGYSDSGKASFDAITPTIGFKFAPNDQIIVRASYSEGFVTPTVSQISEPTSTVTTPTSALRDPVTGKTVASYDAIAGGNPNLKPESSKSINAGIVLTPEFVPDLRLSVDYYQIKKSNNITSVDAQYILDNQNIYADRVKRNTAGEVISIDTTSFNALGLKTSGIDTNLSYKFGSAIGETQFNLGYTYVDEYKQQQTLKTSVVDFVSSNGLGVTDAPLKHRANASIYLQANDTWGFGWATQYYGSYELTNTGVAILNQTGVSGTKLKIEDQIYHDVYARAKLPIGSWTKQKLDFAELGFGIQNLFNDHTVDMSSDTNGYLSKYSDVRGRNYYLNLKLTF